MSRSIDSRFYKRKAWINTRNAYFKSKFGICERCGEPGEEVHHKIELNETNANDPNIAYGWSNLELLCHNCHTRETFTKPRTAKGLKFDDNGDLVKG